MDAGRGCMGRHPANHPQPPGRRNALDYFGLTRNSCGVLSEAEADELLRALAHPARREILRRCWAEPATAGTLSAALDLAPAERVRASQGAAQDRARGAHQGRQSPLVPRRPRPDGRHPSVAGPRSPTSVGSSDMTNGIVHIDIAGPDEAAQHRFLRRTVRLDSRAEGAGVRTPAHARRQPRRRPRRGRRRAASRSGWRSPTSPTRLARAGALGATVVMPAHRQRLGCQGAGL